MNGSFVLALSAIAYALIETEAMKIANKEREAQGHAPAYDESAFYNVAENMAGRVRELANYIQ